MNKGAVMLFTLNKVTEELEAIRGMSVPVNHSIGFIFGYLKLRERLCFSVFSEQ